MKLTYLGQQRHYKPEYSLDEFIRVNEIENYDIGKVLKIMFKLYAFFLDENYPGYFNPYEFENEDTKGGT